MRIKMPKIFQARPVIKSEVQLSEKRVDIILPFHGQYDKVHKALQSIWRTTKSNPYHIYLVDDASPNQSFITSFEKGPRITIMRNEQQLGFGGSLAVGFRESQLRFQKEIDQGIRNLPNLILFMHSDCRVENANWLLELIRTYMILQEKKVGLIVPRTNNPGFDTDSRLKAKQNDEKINDVILDSGFVPLYCALCDRDLFRTIDGFIKPYPFGWYEDEELAHRMRRCGLKQGISGRSWIRHDGGATFNALIKKNPEITKIIETNRERCISDLKLCK